MIHFLQEHGPVIPAAVLVVGVPLVFTVWGLNRTRLREWARREKLTLIDSTWWPISRYTLTRPITHVYRVTVRDPQGRERIGTVCLGSFSLGVYRDWARVYWD